MEKNESTEIKDAIEKFFFFGVSSLAKALVFRTLAKQDLENHERILAAISGYYSLFHLAMAVMYLCPQMLKEKRRKEIFDEIKRTGGLDPSEGRYRIRHDEAQQFISECVSKGLNEKCASLVEEAKRLREYVNYGPRMYIKSGFPVFGDCKIRPEIVDNFIAQLDNCLLEGIKWSQSNSISERYSTMLAIGHIGQFLDDPQLFYLDWCSQEIIEKSKNFLEKIFQELKKHV